MSEAARKIEFDDSLEQRLRNHVIFVLDKSGSMQSIRREAVDLFNQQVEEIQDSAGRMPTTVSLVVFSDPTQEMRAVFWNEPMARLEPLRLEDYRPDGTTALLDAVGRAIERAQAEPDYEDPDLSVLMVVVSDGAENSSKSFSAKKISAMIQRCQETERWTIAYLGANVDLSVVQESYGMAAMNTRSFDANPAAMAATMSDLRGATSRYLTSRRTGQRASVDFYAPATESEEKDGEG